MDLVIDQCVLSLFYLIIIHGIEIKYEINRLLVQVLIPNRPP
jgi:hypothetical protein